MRYGVQLPEVERPVEWSELRDIALAAETVGLDSIWVGDHLLYRDEEGVRGPWEAWTSLAGLAEATSRVALGPLVAATSFHSPAMLAKMASTVDEISGGRLILGLGAGWNETEYRAYGFPYDHRVSRFEEAFTIIRTLIREGHVDFGGEFYELRDMDLRPRARPDLPLMVGSNGPRMLRITAPHIDAWNTWHAWFGNRPEGLAPLIAELESACDDTGADCDGLEKTAAVLVQLERGSGRKSGGRSRPPSEAISGSHEQIAAGLAAFGGTGIDQLQIVLDPIDELGVEELGGIIDSLR